MYRYAPRTRCTKISRRRGTAARDRQRRRDGRAGSWLTRKFDDGHRTPRHAPPRPCLKNILGKGGWNDRKNHKSVNGRGKNVILYVIVKRYYNNFKFFSKNRSGSTTRTRYGGCTVGFRSGPYAANTMVCRHRRKTIKNWNAYNSLLA